MITRRLDTPTARAFWAWVDGAGLDVSRWPRRIDVKCEHDGTDNAIDIVRALAETWPLHDAYCLFIGIGYRCCSCNANTQKDPCAFVHLDSCPWVRAKRMVGE